MGKRGPKPWEPTAAERRTVEHYVSIGYTQEQIAAIMGHSVESLAKYCRGELDTGKLRTDAKIAGKLFEKAMAGDTGALIWWTKARMRWSEKVENEHNFNEGCKVTFERKSSADRHAD